MSYFSDSSSVCSATPVTPSHYHQSNPNSQSLSHTHSHSHSLSDPLSYSSPYDADSLVSPPDSIRMYSSALKARMTAGLTAAMRELKDDRGGPERKFDVEYGYDEDPIERHVRMHLSNRKIPEKSKAVPELGLGMRPTSTPAPPKRGVADGNAGTLAPAHVLGSAANAGGISVNDEDEHDGLPAKFRPGLIQFRRSNSSNNARPPFSRMNSNVSNGSNVSMMSEASFEAVRADDMVSMYAAATSGTSGVKRAEGPFGADHQGDDDDMRRASMDSTDTRDTFRPTKTQRVTPYPEKATGSSYFSAHVGQPPLPVPPPLVSKPTTPPVPPGPTSRPSLLRPRHRALTNDSDSEPDWMIGRTVSEQMVAQAGIRCQRQRVGALRAGR